MHAKHPGVPVDGSTAGYAVPRDAGETLSRPLRPQREPAASRPDRERPTSGDRTVAGRREPVVAGQLAVRWERQDGVLIMWLSGELDQATVTLLDRELDARPLGIMQLIVDLTELEFIDSPGLDALVGIQWRASKRGDRLRFRHGRRVAQRPVELTRTVRLRSRWAARLAGVSDEEDPYFALAMACVSVDHPWSGDRPDAA